MISCAAMAQTSTSGTSFWLGYMENIGLLFNGSPEFSVIVSAEQDASGMIEVPGTGLIIPFEAEGGSSTEIPLPDAIWYSQVSEQIEDKGVLINSDLPIQVRAMHYRYYFCEGANLLPADLLSDEYLVLAAEDFDSDNPSTLVIVATEDSTEVEIIPSTLTQGLRPPGIPFTIDLNRGQIYQIHASQDLSGTVIRSLGSQALAVFSGSQQADIACAQDDSHLWEQMPPVQYWGSEYLVIPYEGMAGDEFKIMAAEDETTIRFNCTEDEIILNSGETYVFESFSQQKIDSDKPIAVAHFNTGDDCNQFSGGPSYALLPSLNYRSTNFKWRAPSAVNNVNGGAYFNRHIAHIVSPTGATDGVLLDGQAIAFEESSALTGWSLAQLEVDAGNHEISSNEPVWVQVAGFRDFDAYSYSLGWDGTYPAGAVDAFAVPGPTGSELCAGEVIFFDYESEQSLDNEFWDFGDGNTAIDPSPTNTYDEPGLYTVLFSGEDSVNCSTSTSFDVEVLDCTNSIRHEEREEIKLIISGNQLQLNSQTSSNTLLQLMDYSGRFIDQSQRGVSFLDLSALPQGVYILRVLGDGPPVSKRFFYGQH